MAKEIERKFLLKEFPVELNQLEGKHIIQGYLSTNPESEIRVRKKKNKFFLTRKIGSGISREETEIEILEDVFNILWDATRKKRIEKVRYEINGFEIDKYLGKLEGLVIAEIELGHENQTFEFPDFLKNVWRLEVTDDARYKNASLAKCEKGVLT